MTVLELAEAHLLNVQREIQVLVQKRNEINNEIERMTAFLNESSSVVGEHKGTTTTEDS